VKRRRGEKEKRGKGEKGSAPQITNSSSPFLLCPFSSVAWLGGIPNSEFAALEAP
jgi:hypothetical protein